MLKCDVTGEEEGEGVGRLWPLFRITDELNKALRRRRLRLLLGLFLSFLRGCDFFVVTFVSSSLNLSELISSRSPAMAVASWPASDFLLSFSS